MVYVQCRSMPNNMPSHTRPARMGNTQYESRNMVYRVYCCCRPGRIPGIARKEKEKGKVFRLLDPKHGMKFLIDTGKWKLNGWPNNAGEGKRQA